MSETCVKYVVYIFNYYIHDTAKNNPNLDVFVF